MHINAITECIISCALKVHRVLGPGVFESIYSACLQYELRRTKLRFEAQVAIPVTYEGMRFDKAFRLDLLVENCVVVELKCCEKLERVHFAQVLSYLRLSGHNVGLLINFHVKYLPDGIKRIVNDLPE
jgi:GxxExxY protein